MKRNRRTPRMRFHAQRGFAKWRGIPFLLTFDQWWKLWQDSGHWNQKGRRKGEYCMARFGDKGAYELGNVRICTVEENHAEWQASHKLTADPYPGFRRDRWTPEQIAKQAAAVRKALTGKPRSAETRAKVSVGHMGRPLSAAHKAAMSVAFKGRHWIIQDGHRTWI